MTDYLIKKLEYWYERCKSFPEETPGGREALLEIRHLVPEVVAALGRADRRVAEEREAIEKIIEAERSRLFAQVQSIDHLTTPAAVARDDGEAARLQMAVAGRVSTCNDLLTAIRSRSNDSQPAPSPVGNRDVLTARNTVASPISQEIAPEALSEGDTGETYDWSRSVGCVRIQFSGREDGGLRICSDDVPGLVLSGGDAQAVWRDLGVALEVLLRRNTRAQRNPSAVTNDVEKATEPPTGA